MKKLEEQSMEGLKHAKILASRIIQLGGTPTTKPIETSTLAFLHHHKIEQILDQTETAKLRKLITKRGTLEILIPLCWY